MQIQAEPAAGSESVSDWDGWSPDRRLRVTLRRAWRACTWNAVMRRAPKREIVQGLMFTDEREFLGWCDAETMLGSTTR